MLFVEDKTTSIELPAELLLTVDAIGMEEEEMETGVEAASASTPDDAYELDAILLPELVEEITELVTGANEELIIASLDDVATCSTEEETAELSSTMALEEDRIVDITALLVVGISALASVLVLEILELEADDVSIAEEVVTGVELDDSMTGTAEDRIVVVSLEDVKYDRRTDDNIELSKLEVTTEVVGTEDVVSEVVEDVVGTTTGVVEVVEVVEVVVTEVVVVVFEELEPIF